MDQLFFQLFNFLSFLGSKIPPNFTKAALILGLTFALILVIALTRRHFLEWSIKGALFGILIGFALALILEGFLIIGGRTALTEVLGWRNPPRPIKLVIDEGRERLSEVLGKSIEIETSSAQEKSFETFIESFQSLPPDQASKVRRTICEP